MASDLLGEQPVLLLHAEAAIVDDQRRPARRLAVGDDGDVRLGEAAVGNVVGCLLHISEPTRPY